MNLLKIAVTGAAGIRLEGLDVFDGVNVSSRPTLFFVAHPQYSRSGAFASWMRCHI